MDEGVLEVLKEIRDEAKQTNVRLESLEGRVVFLEKRVSKGLGDVNEKLSQGLGEVNQKLSQGLGEVNQKLDAHVERLELMSRRQTESELRLASGVLSLSEVTREVRDLLSQKLDDHKMVLEHEYRLRSVEERIADRSSE